MAFFCKARLFRNWLHLQHSIRTIASEILSLFSLAFYSHQLKLNKCTIAEIIPFSPSSSNNRYIFLIFIPQLDDAICIKLDNKNFVRCALRVIEKALFDAGESPLARFYADQLIKCGEKSFCFKLINTHFTFHNFCSHLRIISIKLNALAVWLAG